MYDMIELDSRTKDILEPLFGRTRDGDGYYDGRDCLELKINHCPIEEYSQRHQAVLDVLVEKARAYGLPLDSPPSSHLNFSFWDEQGNIMHPDHPDYTTKGKVIIEGITHGLYDALPLIMKSSNMAQTAHEDVTFNFSTNRKGFLRSATGRYEIRPNIYHTEQHTDLMILPVLAGALSALENQHNPDYTQEYKQARVIGSGCFTKPKDELKVFTHVLSNSEINPDGSITAPENYILSKSDDLAFNLGLINTEKPAEMFSEIMNVSNYKNNILEFIKGIKVDKNGDQPKIIFPTNSPKGYIFKTPEISLDKIPLEVANKIRSGIDPQTIKDEWDDYIYVGDGNPCAAKEYFIDTESLSKKIGITKIEDRLIITDGYDFNTAKIFGDARDEEPLLYSKIDRMKNSAILKNALSTEFCTALNETIETAIPRPITIETVDQEKKEDIKALLQAAFETQLDKKPTKKSVNLYNIKRKTGFNNELEMEIAATLADIIGIEHAGYILNQISIDRNKEEHLGNKLTLSDYLVEEALPRIQADPVRVAEYKKIMQKDIISEMREIAAEKPTNLDPTATIVAKSQGPDDKKHAVGSND